MNKLKTILWIVFIVYGAKAQIAMPSMRGVLSSKVATTMYSGGIGIGNSQSNLLQSTCLAPNIETIYYGGDGI